MAYTLHIELEGLILFVPEVPFDRYPKKVTALFPNLIFPRKLRLGWGQKRKGFPDILEPHYPVLEVAKANLRRGVPHTDEPEIEIIKRNHALNTYVFQLFWMDVEIWPGDKPQRTGCLTAVNGTPDPDLLAGRREPQGAEKRWIRWVGDTAAASRHGMVPQRFAGPLKDQDPDVITRVVLSDGELSTATLQNALFAFKPGCHKQWLAKSLSWEFEGLEYDTRIVFRPFGPFRERHIFVGPAHGQKEVEISLYNREAPPLLRIDNAFLRQAQNKLNNPEFQGLYGLIKPFCDQRFHIRPRPFPIMVPDTATGGPIGARPGGCSPGAGQGFADS